MAIVKPVYKLGWFPRKCQHCGKFTRDRICHEISFIENFSELKVGNVKFVLHKDCHNKMCQDRDCRKFLKTNGGPREAEFITCYG
jgi:hypothetical protein